MRPIQIPLVTITAVLAVFASTAFTGCDKKPTPAGVPQASPAAPGAVSVDAQRKAAALVDEAAASAKDGDLRTAREKYRAALALDPKNSDARAGADLIIVPAQDVTRARSMVTEANGLFTKGEPLRAHRILYDAMRLDPNNREATVKAAESARTVRRFDVARQILEEAIQRSPNDPEFLARAALVAYDQSDWAGCLDLCSRIDPLMEKNPQIRDNAEFWFMRSVAAKRRELAPEAIADLERATRLKPKNFEFHDYLGRALLDDGKFDLAERSFRQAIELKPDLATGWYHIARCRQKRGEHEKAVESFKKAISFDNTQWEWNLQIAHSYELLNTKDDWNRALGYCDVALHMNPLAHEALLTTANVMRKLGQAAEAEKYMTKFAKVKAVATENEEKIRPLRRRITANASDTDAYLKIIELEVSHKHLDEAFDDVRLLLLVDPRNAEGISHAFRILFAQNDLNAAKWEAMKLVDYHPNDARGPLFLATLAFKTGNAKEALANAERAYSINQNEFGAVELMMYYYSNDPARSADARRLAPLYNSLRAKAEAEAVEVKKRQEAFEKQFTEEPTKN